MYFSVRGVDTFICILVSGCRYLYMYFSVRGVDAFICILVSGVSIRLCVFFSQGCRYVYVYFSVRVSIPLYVF